MTLLNKWTSRLMDRSDLEWAKMFKVNVELVRWKSDIIYRRNHYSLKDKILFGTISEFGALKYSFGLWEAWIRIRPTLHLFPRVASMSGFGHLVDVVELLPVYTVLSAFDKGEVLSALARIGILNIMHLWAQDSTVPIVFEPALNMA